MVGAIESIPQGAVLWGRVIVSRPQYILVQARYRHELSYPVDVSESRAMSLYQLNRLLPVML